MDKKLVTQLTVSYVLTVEALYALFRWATDTWKNTAPSEHVTVMLAIASIAATAAIFTAYIAGDERS